MIRDRVSLAPSRGAFLLLYHRRQELEIGESEIAFGMPWNAKHGEAWKKARAFDDSGSWTSMDPARHVFNGAWKGGFCPLRRS
jgi:hypothetical protein